MAVRHAHPDEAESLWRVRNESIRSSCKEIYDDETIAAFTPDLMPEGYRRAIAATPFFVIDDPFTRQPVATGFLDIEACSVEAIFTLPQYQRRGFATQILNAIKAESKRREIQKLYLSSTPNAVPFYQKNGFNILKISEYFSGTANRALRCVEMSADLD
ncbi:GNAT family N-acetyltransferase [Affinibrenneria salicis]|uniref:GNAT family N-acetyltransferase n=1 Tax=Affinibrenneria salicis TaxID=2590031 RepID=A0A5J5FTX2_9GAMM|nr:GNAT family N-acetyltransferase [Affinibrenneria salicis]KAA8996613.1 GNAT family N-acetyltransferase [Affinibrenneria salicis]